MRLFVLFAALYFCIPPAMTLLDPRFRGEVYPLSMWSMFYRVHNRMDDYGVRILSIDGKNLRNPRYFEHAKLSKSHSISAYHAIQKLGRATEGGDESRVASARRTVERAYLGQRRITYELVSRKWDPYERFMNNEFIEEKVLGQFESRRGKRP